LPECRGPLAVLPLLQTTRHGYPSTNQAGPALGEALAAAAGELGHAASTPLPRRTWSRCAAPWPATAAPPPWPPAAAPPSALYRDPPPPLKPGSTLEGVDSSIPVSGVPSLRAAGRRPPEGIHGAAGTSPCSVCVGGSVSWGGGDLFLFFGRGGWSQVFLGWQNHCNFGEL
jgi:hypothetical protein